MAYYEITHPYPIHHTTQSLLAAELTRLHAAAFHIPHFFITVQFHHRDPSRHPVYNSGRLARPHAQIHIHMPIQPTPSASTSVATTQSRTLATLSQSIATAWRSSSTQDPTADAPAHPAPATELRSIIFHGTVIGARERGWWVPSTDGEGDDVDAHDVLRLTAGGLRGRVAEFRVRARTARRLEEREAYQELVDELEWRGDLWGGEDEGEKEEGRMQGTSPPPPRLPAFPRRGEEGAMIEEEECTVS